MKKGLVVSIGILFFIAVIFILVAGVMGKLGSEEGGEEMIKNIYIYLVLFATLMMTIGGSVAVFMAVADIVSPVSYYQTFEDYKLSTDKTYVDRNEGKAQFTEQELKDNYEAMVLSEKERQINRAKNTLIKSFGWIVIPFPIFLYFQRRLVKKVG